MTEQVHFDQLVAAALPSTAKMSTPCRRSSGRRGVWNWNSKDLKLARFLVKHHFPHETGSRCTLEHLVHTSEKYKSLLSNRRMDEICVKVSSLKRPSARATAVCDERSNSNCNYEWGEEQRECLECYAKWVPIQNLDEAGWKFQLKTTGKRIQRAFKNVPFERILNEALLLRRSQGIEKIEWPSNRYSKEELEEEIELSHTEEAPIPEPKELIAGNVNEEECSTNLEILSNVSLDMAFNPIFFLQSLKMNEMTPQQQCETITAMAKLVQWQRQQEPLVVSSP